MCNEIPLPVRFLASISSKRCLILFAARPALSNAISTHSWNLRIIALMRCTIAPKLIWCIGSCMRIWCTKKCWIFQNAIKSRWAPARARTVCSWLCWGRVSVHGRVPRHSWQLVLLVASHGIEGSLLLQRALYHVACHDRTSMQIQLWTWILFSLQCSSGRYEPVRM